MAKCFFDLISLYVPFANTSRLQRTFIWLSFLCFLITPGQAHAQYRAIGTPMISSYGSFDKMQINDVAITRNKNFFVGHSEGLSILLGSGCIDLPSLRGHNITSLDTLGDRLYVIGPSTFGYVVQDVSGLLNFFSITPTGSADTREEQPAIASTGTVISYKKGSILNRYNERSQKHLAPVDSLIGQYKSSNFVCYQFIKRGLVLSSGKALKGTAILEKYPLQNVLPFGPDKYIILSKNDGLFIHDSVSVSRWSRETYEVFSSQGLINGVVWNDKIIILSDKTVYILNARGKIVDQFDLPQHKNRFKGLFVDTDNNLVLSGKSGIIKVYLNLPARMLCPDICGQINDVEIYNERLYLGTPNGLFYTDWSEEGPYEYSPKFRLVNNSRGEVYSLDIIRNDLLMGHEDGAFHIYDNRAIKLSRSKKVYTFKPFRYDNTVLAGTDKGIDLYKKVKHRLLFDRQLKGVDFPVKQLEENNDTLFVLSSEGKVSKVFVYPNMRTSRVLTAEISDSSTLNNLTKLGNDIYVCSSDNIFRYEPSDGAFSDQNTLSEILSLQKNIRFLREDINENIWYISRNNPGLLELTEDSISETYNHFPLKDYLPLSPGLTVNNVFSYNKENTFLSTSSGVLYTDCSKIKKQARDIPSILNALTVNDSLLYYSGSGLNSSLVLEAEENNLSFFFTQPESGYRYSFFLSREDSLSWSKWQVLPEAQFENLAPGKYSFSVKGKSLEDNNVNISSMDITINRPDFSFPFKYLSYVLGALVLIALILLIPSFFYRHRMRKLQHSIVEKDLSQAINTLLIKSKAEKSISGEFSRLSEEKGRVSSKRASEIINITSPTYEDWEEFFFQFEQVNPAFLNRLIKKHPTLSQEEQRQCIFYKAKLSDEEVSMLRGVGLSQVVSMNKALEKAFKLRRSIKLQDYLRAL